MSIVSLTAAPDVVTSEASLVASPGAVCDVCLGTRPSPVFCSLPWLIRCSGCGTWRVSPQPAAEELERIYSERYFESFGVHGEGAAGYRDIKVAGARQWLRLLESQHSAGRLLDVGCGLGEMLSEARSRGWEASGIDRNPQAARAAAAASKSPVVCGDIEREAIVSAGHDAITCLDVFEHMRSPRRLLANLHGALERDGVLLIVTIDNGNWLARLSGPAWVHIHRDHLWYFNRSGLRRMITECGFAVLAGGRAWKRYTLRYVCTTLAHHARSRVARSLFESIVRMSPNILCALAGSAGRSMGPRTQGRHAVFGRHPMLRSHRPGFTLIELIVVIAIISVVAALLMPAVQAARESSRRTTCRNNIRSLALALHQYHDVHSVLPLNYGNGPFSADNNGCSWMQLILPHVDQANIHKQIFFGWPLSDPQNTQIAKTRIPVYECPSDTHGGRMTFRANVPGVWAVNNYKASCGANWAWGQFSPIVTQKGRNALKPDGLDENTGLIGRCGWGRVTTTRLADVRDGATTTFALGEAVPEWSRHTWWGWFNATTATCAIPLNFRNEPDLQDAGQGDWHHNYSFKSRHTGGGHFAFVDGSVRFINDSIDRDVYRGLGTIQGSEVIATEL